MHGRRDRVWLALSWAAILVWCGCGRIGFDASGARGAPLLALTSPAEVTTSDGTASFTGSCSRPTDVRATGPETVQFFCDGSFRFEVTLSGPGRQEWALRPVGYPEVEPLVVTAVWDGEPPVIDSFRIDPSALSSRNVVPVDLLARDAASYVDAFCILSQSRPHSALGTPVAGDPCWTPVEAPSPGLVAGPTLELEDFPFLLGFQSGTYDLIAWVRDEAGNVSLPSMVATHEYRQDSPPVVTDVFATSAAAPADPPLTSDLTAGPGTPVHIKWAAVDDASLPARPIRLFYTTDDVRFVPITADLENGSNAGCTVDDAGSTDDAATGCFTWTTGPPSAVYFRVRVVAEDRGGQTTAATSPPLNTPSFRFIAGNTDPGTDASARAALFFGAVHPSSLEDPDRGNMVVLPDGRLFFRDVRRGLLMVNPSDGVQRVAIPTTGESTGDGGPAAAASLRLPQRITLDGQGRLLIFDYDRIRRLDIDEPGMPIETVIGGGTSVDDGVGPREVLIEPPSEDHHGKALAMAFFALPNGDVWFQSRRYTNEPDQGHGYRVYDAATETVGSVRISGALSDGSGLLIGGCPVNNLGVTYDLVTSEITHAQVTHESGPNNASCMTTLTGGAIHGIDPRTGTLTGVNPVQFTEGWLWARLAFPVQGADGRLYMLSRISSMIFRYEPSTRMFEPIAGSGSVGRCADGTPALECDMNIIDMYVTQRGQLWISDLGRIRVVDEDGAMLTIMGQTPDFGDGGRPGSARFADVTSLDLWDDGTGTRFVLLDKDTLKFREIGPGAAVQTIAGNGSEQTPDVTTPAINDGLDVFTGGRVYPHFVVEPAGGALWFSRGRQHLARLNRSSGFWEDRVGGGATAYHDPAAAAVTGPEVDLGPSGFVAYPAGPIGYSPTQILLHRHIHDPTIRRTIESRVLEVALDVGSVRSVMGTPEPTDGDLCPDGTVLSACTLPPASAAMGAAWDALGRRWVYGIQDTHEVRVLEGGRLQTLATFVSVVRGFDYRRDSPADGGTVYSCGDDGLLHTFDVAMGAETSIPLPGPAMRCLGPVRYSADRRSLVFAYGQHGSAALAEYLVP